MFTNTTDKNLVLLKPISDGFDYCDTAIITGPDGAKVDGSRLTPKKPPSNVPTGGNYSGWDENYKIIEPSGEYRVSFGKDFKPVAVGAYTIKIIYDSLEKPRGAVSEQLPKQKWSGKIESNVFEFHITDANSNTDKNNNGQTTAADPERKLNEPAWITDFKGKIQRKVNINFANASIDEALAYLRQISGVPMIVDINSGAPMRAIDLELKDVTVEIGLGRVLAAEHLEYGFVDYAIYIASADEIARAKATPHIASNEMKLLLSRKVSFEFADRTLNDAATDLTKMTNVKVKVDPEISADRIKKFTITLAVQDLNLESALRWIARMSRTQIREQDGGILFFKP